MINPSARPEPNSERIRRWVEVAGLHPGKCFICSQIASENRAGEGILRAIKISGVELTAEVQISHLARCVGGKDGEASEGAPASGGGRPE